MDYLPETFLVEGIPTNDKAIADTETHYGREIAFGIAGWASGLLTIENGLDQTVTITVYGRNHAEDTWQAIETGTAVTASSTGVIDILNPWAQIRVGAVCGVAPSSGSVSCYLVRNKAAGTAGGSSVLPTSVEITDIEGFDTVKGQKTEAESFPVVPPSDGEYNAAAVATGATTDAAVVTDAVGTLSSKLRGLVKWAFERMPAALGQALMNASLPVAIASDQSQVYVKQRGDTISQTPTVTAGAYSAGDCVGGELTFVNAARTAGEGGFVTDVVVVDDAGQDVALELWLFDQTITSPGDNAAWAATEAELHNLVAIYATDDGQWRAAGTPSVCHLKEVARFQAVGTSLFGQLVTRGTPTFAATDDVTVKIKVAQDD